MGADFKSYSLVRRHFISIDAPVGLRRWSSSEWNSDAKIMSSNNSHISKAQITGDLWCTLGGAAPDWIRRSAPWSLSCSVHCSNLELIVAVLLESCNLVLQIVDH